MSAPAALVKGQNASLSEASVVVTVEISAPVDLSALLVTQAGKVRSDDDFVFFNQPEAPGVRCRQPASGQPGRIELDLPRIPSDIDQVRVVVALADTQSRFGSFPPPVAVVTGSSGAPIASYQATGLSSESIVIVVEVYRRSGGWKVRAVGQGYAGGLAALITDHGVSVDDPGEAPAAPPAAPPTAPPTAPRTAPPTAPPRPAAPVASGYPPPAAPIPPAAPGYPAPARRPVNFPPPSGPAANFPPPGGPAANFPPPGGPAANPPPRTGPPPPVALPAGEVSLVKGRSVSLLKGQRVSLRKEGGVALTRVRMGLGWDPIKKRGMFGGREVQIDLDASALLFAGSQPADIVFYNGLRSKDGSVQHMGDNRTGEGSGDDETIAVDLQAVPAQITTLFFVVTSYEGQTFEQVENAFCRLVDAANDGELARYTLGGGGNYTAMVMAKVFREGGSWKLQAIGEGMQARTPRDAVGQLARFL